MKLIEHNMLTVIVDNHIVKALVDKKASQSCGFSSVVTKLKSQSTDLFPGKCQFLTAVIGLKINVLGRVEILNIPLSV
jgi:hypothetical protein